MDFSVKLEEYELPKIGSVKKARIVEIVNGPLKDFVQQQHWMSFKSKDGTEGYYRVKSLTSDNDEVIDLIPAPTKKVVNDLSKMAKWMRAYKGPPKLDQETLVIMDSKGRYKTQL